jgi:mono/diheme cytochrome c family protein
MNTKALLRIVARGIALLVVAGLVGGAYLVTTGLSAHSQPGTIEAVAARAVRGLAIRAHAGSTSNPVAGNDEAIAEGREHFADHCAICHANDGSGNIEIGQALYPKAPDMRLPATQSLSDAELFYIIENGVRFTGMPGWGTGTKEGETASWHLVHFIRHLPRVTPEEIEQMEALNPRSRKEVLQQIEEEKFLQGGDVASPPSSTTHEHSGEHK